MKKERFKAIPAVYTIFRRGNEILLSRRFNTGFQDGKYSLPAGHHDGGMTLRSSAAREAKEEVGVAMQLADLDFVYAQHRLADDGERLDYFFTCDVWSGEPQNMEPDKCDELRWCDVASLPENIVPNVKAALEGYLRGKCYGECEC